MLLLIKRILRGVQMIGLYERRQRGADVFDAQRTPVRAAQKPVLSGGGWHYSEYAPERKAKRPAACFFHRQQALSAA